MWAAVTKTYRDAWRFAIALPWLIALAIGFEALEHVVDWSIGMYSSHTAALRLQFHPARMVTGAAKVLVIYAIAYWVVRYVLSGYSRGATLRSDPTAHRRYAAVVVFGLFVGIGSLAAGVLLPGTVIPRVLIAAILTIIFVGRTIANVALAY